ncbi:MAG: CHC2 zinc finger domain-containing protein [Ginsengibacter sp.]
MGHEPSKIKGNDYWYSSPLRNEKTPSFKVNRKLNRWYDHGLGKGGNIIDFAILYNNCTIGEFLNQLSGHLSFQKPFKKFEENPPNGSTEGKIYIVQKKPISSLVLLRYLHKRRIPMDIAERFCVEVINRLVT